MHQVIKKSDIPASGLYATPKPHPRTEQIREFIAGNDEAWEVFPEDGMPPHNLYSSLRNVILKNPYFKSRVYAIERVNRVFLVRF